MPGRIEFQAGRLTLHPLLGYNGGVDNLLSGLRAALFDLDGTLVETHIDFALMKRETLALVTRWGIDTPGWEALDILGIIEKARAQLEAEGRTEEARRFRSEAFAQLESIEVEQCAHPVAIPGAAELLAGLRARRIPVGIVTRNCSTVASRLLTSGGLAHDVLLTRDDVPRTKPDPEHLFAALAAMGVESRESRVESRSEGTSLLTPHACGRGNPTPSRRRCTPARGRRFAALVAALAPTRLTPDGLTPYSSCLMVGDHWMDVQAGRAACMRTVGIRRGRPESFFAPAPPDLLVDELQDLLPLLDDLSPERMKG